MARAFNDDQKDFIDSMSSNFRSSDVEIDRVLIMIYGLIGFFLVVIAIYFFLRYRFRIRGKIIELRKVIDGVQRPEKRSHKRVSVTIALPRGPDIAEHTYTLDLSPGGMFVKMRDPIPVGDHIEYLLTLGPQKRIKGIAEVKWIQPGWSEHHPTGMGCKFLDLSDQDTAALRQFCLRS